MPKSLLDYAFDFVSGQKNHVSFKELWGYIVKEAGLSEEEAQNKVSRFYTNLMLDGRFVTLGENEWDLRERHTFDKVHIDMRNVYADVETVDDDSEDAEDEKEYNEAFEEPKEENDESDGSQEDEEEEEDIDTF